MSETTGPDAPEASVGASAEAETDSVSITTASIRPVDNPDAYPPIRMLGLRLRGVHRDYAIDFTDERDVGRDRR